MVSPSRRPEIIFDGQHLQVLHLPGDSDYALVTFHIMHAVADGRNAFASRLAAKNGIELWGVVPKAPNWYPTAEMAQAAALIRSRLDRPALAYGASMGGYAALRWARAAGCKSALAFSPQAHIDPEVTGKGDPRYGRYYDPALNADMDIRPEHLADSAFAIVDPDTAPDLIQAALLPRDPQLRIFHLTHMGHKTAGAIASSSVAKTVFAFAFAGNGAGIIRALRRNRRNAVSFHVSLGRACLARGHKTWALSILNAAHSRFGPDNELVLALAEAQCANRDFAEAVANLRALVNRFPHVAKFRLSLIRTLEDWPGADSTPDLLALAEALENVQIWLKLVKRLLGDGRTDEASIWSARIAAKWPEHARRLSALQPQRLEDGRPDGLVNG